MRIPIITGNRLWLTIYWWLWSLFIPKSTKDDFYRLTTMLSTPIRCQAWMWANLTYRKDTKFWHSWQSALVTFTEREGDCEDWAIFAEACLGHRYTSCFLCIYTKDKGHAIFLVEAAPGSSWTSLGTFGLNYHQGSIRDIIADWPGYEDWTFAVIMEDDLTPRSAIYR